MYMEVVTSQSSVVFLRHTVVSSYSWLLTFWQVYASFGVLLLFKPKYLRVLLVGSLVDNAVIRLYGRKSTLVYGSMIAIKRDLAHIRRDYIEH